MYIEKIEVPAFRALRDICLDFSGPYDPQIFPLGSENGGGKSTLLQLLFTLLHCSGGSPEHLPYLQNLLATDTSAEEPSNGERLLAKITLRIDDETHELHFLSLGDVFLQNTLDDPPKYGFCTEYEQERLRGQLRRLTEKLDRLNEASPHIKDGEALSQSAAKFLTWKDFRDEPGYPPRNPREAATFTNSLLRRIPEQAKDIQIAIERLDEDLERVRAILRASDFHHITNYRADWHRALVCQIPGRPPPSVEALLHAVSAKVFLLGPSNQQYLFLGKKERKALLESRTSTRQRRIKPYLEDHPRPQIEYLSALDEAEQAMPGFFAYDWLSVSPLVELFRIARDEDFKQVVKTGRYGDTYTQLMKEVNTLLLGKRVRPLEDLSGIQFEVVRADGAATELNPEDLSQGELKRLMIYAWLRANNAFDALVLIDEIEASFHPDWQVRIVRDLKDWAPNNQYILATHSYELCQALTPRHVRELKPQLKPREPDAPK
jgi:energy-coupling factor transporter ATP-binding protein EcfA2